MVAPANVIDADVMTALAVPRLDKVMKLGPVAAHSTAKAVPVEIKWEIVTLTVWTCAVFVDEPNRPKTNPPIATAAMSVTAMISTVAMIGEIAFLP